MHSPFKDPLIVESEQPKLRTGDGKIISPFQIPFTDNEVVPPPVPDTDVMETAVTEPEVLEKENTDTEITDTEVRDNDYEMSDQPLDYEDDIMEKDFLVDEDYQEVEIWRELEINFMEHDSRDDSKLAIKIGKHFNVSSTIVQEYDWVFRKPWGEKFRKLVESVSAEAGLNPGLVAVNMISETKAHYYLQSRAISSFIVGVDDFYDKRADVKRKVPAYPKISWSRPTDLTNVNERGRTVNSVYFKSGKDAALASAVYLKHGEEVLREEASSLGKNFDAIPLETRFALLRLAFNAGNGRAKINLREFLNENQPVLILKRQKQAGPQRRATIKAAMAIYISETFFATPLPLPVTKETSGTGEDEETFDNLSDKETTPVNSPSCTINPALKNKIGFEFDMLLSMTSDIKISRTLDADTRVSEHTQTTDGFELKIDGNKIEVSTKPFELSSAGLTELKATFKKIENWLAALKKSFTDHKKEINIPEDVSCPDCFSGKGSFASTKDAGALLKIKDEFITAQEHFIFPLKTARTINNNYYANYTGMRGVPQATLGIPLEKVNTLVDKIRSSQNEPVGIGMAVTGSKLRIGIRSDALYNAQERVNTARRFFLKAGTVNSLQITKSNFSEKFTGFLILVVQYLWTSVLPIDPRDDREGYSKAYVPLHSKTRFREMYHCLLNKEERELFEKIFWEGDNWKNLFSLTKKIGTRYGGYQDIEDTPNIRLFPEGMVQVEPTWKQFITSIIENNFDVEKDSGDDTLVSNPVKAIPLKNNGVVLELRRMAYGSLPSGKWLDMATRLFAMAKELNS